MTARHLVTIATRVLRGHLLACLVLASWILSQHRCTFQKKGQIPTAVNAFNLAMGASSEPLPAKTNRDALKAQSGEQYIITSANQNPCRPHVADNKARQVAKMDGTVNLRKLCRPADVVLTRRLNEGGHIMATYEKQKLDLNRLIASIVSTPKSML